MSDPTSSGPRGGGPRGKRATRETLFALREALLPEERVAASARIAERANALIDDELTGGSVLALYASKGSEVETAAIDAHARARGIRVVYPRIVDDQRQLGFYEVTPDQLVPSKKFGLREPDASAPRVALIEITAFVLPGLAFDRDGGRVGWGRGYYDATLEDAPIALRIGLAYECQIIDRVPRDPHDVALHYLITEAETITVS